MKEKSYFSELLILVSLLAVSLSQADDGGQDSITTIEVSAAKDFVAQEYLAPPGVRLHDAVPDGNGWVWYTARSRDGGLLGGVNGRLRFGLDLRARAWLLSRSLHRPRQWLLFPHQYRQLTRPRSDGHATDVNPEC